MRFHLHSSPAQRGLTLLELIVAIAILTLLAGLLIPLTKNAIDDAKVAKIISLVENLGRAAKKYWFDTNLLAVEDTQPASERHDLFSNNAGSLWKGPYIDSPVTIGMNPWGTDLRLSDSINGTIIPVGEEDGYKISGIPVGPGPGGELRLFNLPLEIARKLDLAVDGQPGPVDERCEYTPQVNPDGTVTATVCIFLFQAK